MSRYFRPRLVLLFALSLFLAPVGAAAEDRAAIEKIVENYIRTHPEVVMEALQKYQDQQRLAQEEAAFQESVRDRVTVPLGDAPAFGPKDAPITLIEFSDFQCPYCARSFATVEGIVRKYKGKLRIVFKHNPLPFHAKARPAHKASIAAHRQGKFWPYREILMTRQGEWSAGDTPKLLNKYAAEAGLDLTRFAKDMADPKLDALIDADMAQGQKIGVQGTPTYVVNGALVRGARDADYFERVIAATKKK
ncbi:MAG: thioredoxin domain-containing protein [Nitrospinae bacterium]|nr:thioredoxin domain-containing protein [Nitrospinota bacterium]